MDNQQEIPILEPHGMNGNNPQDISDNVYRFNGDEEEWTVLWVIYYLVMWDSSYNNDKQSFYNNAVELCDKYDLDIEFYTDIVTGTDEGIEEE